MSCHFHHSAISSCSSIKKGKLTQHCMSKGSLIRHCTSKRLLI